AGRDVVCAAAGLDVHRNGDARIDHHGVVLFAAENADLPHLAESDLFSGGVIGHAPDFPAVFAEVDGEAVAGERLAMNDEHAAVQADAGRVEGGGHHLPRLQRLEDSL